jgi:hypothetical protein
MAHHLQPLGVLIIEPWLTPEQWVVDRPALFSVDRGDLKIARMNVSGRDGRLAIVEFHYLIGSPAGVEHFTERHEIALFTDSEYGMALTQAQLTVEHDDYGLTGRGLHIATKQA